MKALLSLLALFFSFQLAEAQSKGHAHNDYLHRRPLLDALDQEFTSLEIDVYARGKQLRVSHLPTVLVLKPNLQKLYLNPLKEMLDEQGNAYFQEGQQLILMVDFKSNWKRCLPLLKKALEPLAPYLQSVQDLESNKPLKVLITGHKPPIEALDPKGYLALDGNFSDLGQGHPLALMPRISAPFKKHFEWKGTGQMPADQYKTLLKWVEAVHAEGRKIRFWGIPDQPAVWRVLTRAGVDWINTDDLAGYRQWRGGSPSN